MAHLERHGYPHEITVSALPSLPPDDGVRVAPGDRHPAARRRHDPRRRPRLERLPPPRPLSPRTCCSSTGPRRRRSPAITSSAAPARTRSSRRRGGARSDETTERLRSLQLFVESMRKTADDDLLLILPGHGPLVGPPGDLVAERLAFHEKRAGTFPGDARPQRAADHLRALATTDVKGRRDDAAIAHPLRGDRHLDLLEAEGRVSEGS